MADCGGFSLVGVAGSDCGVYPLTCKRWECRTCGQKKLRATIARIHTGMRQGECRFFTITSPGREDAATSYAELPARWKRLHERIARRWGRIEYVTVVEAQKRGHAHLHVVYRGRYIPQPWLSRAAKASGFGPIADIRRPPRAIAGYVAKYLTKDLGASGVRMRDGSPFRLPKYFRRVRFTPGWCTWTKRAHERRWSVWYLTDAPPVPTARSARARRLDVAELVLNGWPAPRHWRAVHWFRGFRDHRSAPPFPGMTAPRDRAC
jgi:hypothetical protein